MVAEEQGMHYIVHVLCNRLKNGEELGCIMDAYIPLYAEDMSSACRKSVKWYNDIWQ